MQRASGEHRVLLVTTRLEPSPSGGREMLSKLNHDLLRATYGDRLTLFETMPSGRAGSAGGLRRALAGHIDGIDPQTLDAAMEIVRREGITKVLVDGSNLGTLVSVLKRSTPGVEVTTFFHNVEARFFWGSLRMRRSVHALGVLLANYLAERRAVRHSDKIVCLSERDSKLLRRVYGRGATHISPMALADRFSEHEGKPAPSASEGFALFVGGTFYANRAGMAWYVREVAARSNVKVVVVGKGFEALRNELQVPGKVEVIGAVDSLADWYSRAQFVIAPIFDGSGMKTKVAEALMYGKKVVGTPEAFSGYENIASQAGWVAASADEFKAAMDAAQRTIRSTFFPDLRKLYLRLYSFPAAQERMHMIMEGSRGL